MLAGKLPLDMLTELLGKIERVDSRVVLGASPGEDAALIDMGDRYLVAKSDPITFATDLIGWYLVQVNANDLAVMGATPRWLMATLLLPEGVSEAEVRAIFDQLLDACRSHGIALIGGHTEVTHGLPRPIAVGALLGEAAKYEVVLTSGARPGDSVVLTKGIAIEGTAILAREAGAELAAAGVPPRLVEEAREMLFSPGISVRKDAEVARMAVPVHAMHDPTEGGLATALRELAVAAGVGLELELAAIPVLPACRAFCDALGLDPLGLIASGALLATVASEDAAPLIEALGVEGIPAWEIGRVTPADEGLTLRTPSGTAPLPEFERDELARYFGGTEAQPG